MTTTLPAPTAPFLVWPVARREFYRAISIALLPTFAWAVIIFGWRVAGMIIGSSGAVWISHTILKRFTERGKLLVFPHSLVAAWILVALAEPAWPIWLVSVTALFIPPALWLAGGPGKERVHVAVLAVILLQLLLVPILHNETINDAILARDRLVMGDIRNQAELPLYRWPWSPEISGNDALHVNRPARISSETLDTLSHTLASRDLWGGGHGHPQTNQLSQTARNRALNVIDAALGRLPNMDLFLLGAAPGRVGAVSFIGLIFGGLYLAYRYILRIRSVALFLASYLLASAFFALLPAILGQHFSPAPPLRIWAAFPGEIITFVIYLTLGTDAFLAAVFILALPGTEPLTPRGRRVFLFFAAILAAIFARINFILPPCTFAICLLMPLAPTFDHYFAKRSWLNRFRM